MSGKKSKRWVYLIGSPALRTVKIGVSNDPDARLADLQVGSPVALHLLWKTPGGQGLEAALHAYFAATAHAASGSTSASVPRCCAANAIGSRCAARCAPGGCGVSGPVLSISRGENRSFRDGVPQSWLRACPVWCDAVFLDQKPTALALKLRVGGGS
ncbi:GIY-YIG nuclease family protein [Embleya sp. NPDC059237]|uniref:GIY-YIG nuclease family protein n=1 Tax=Embleya sp. NPDC059237 TaxID=3346784 RepID=UPI0036A33345